MRKFLLLLVSFALVSVAFSAGKATMASNLAEYTGLMIKLREFATVMMIMTVIGLGLMFVSSPQRSLVNDRVMKLIVAMRLFVILLTSYVAGAAFPPLMLEWGLALAVIYQLIFELVATVVMVNEISFAMFQKR